MRSQSTVSKPRAPGVDRLRAPRGVTGALRRRFRGEPDRDYRETQWGRSVTATSSSVEHRQWVATASAPSRIGDLEAWPAAGRGNRRPGHRDGARRPARPAPRQRHYASETVCPAHALPGSRVPRASRGAGACRRGSRDRNRRHERMRRVSVEHQHSLAAGREANGGCRASS